MLCRAYGCDAPVGAVYGVNPLIIIFLVPLVSPHRHCHMLSYERVCYT